MTQISSNFRRITLTALLVAVPLESAWAQVIPNPLVRPQRPQSAASDQPSAPDAQQSRGANAAQSAGRANGRPGRAIDGEGLPDDATKEKSPSEQLSSLYVSAVIGDRAVLRSLEVRVVPPLNANVPGGGAGSSATRSGETPSASAGGGGSGANSGVGVGPGGLRSAMHVVRNGEVLPFLDKLRLLVRVRDTTVTLYDVTDVPATNYDPLDLMDRGLPVAFRGSVDSVQAAPYVPSSLVVPGTGVDGAAFESARDTRFRGADGGTGSATSSSSTGSSSSPSGMNNR